MKLLIATAMLALLMDSAFPQSAGPYPKTISVTGTAEMEIVPDEIYVLVTLKEYKRGSTKTPLATIRTGFLDICRTVGVPDSNVSLSMYAGYANYWYVRRSHRDDLFSTLTYQVKFSNTAQMDHMVDRLDDDATQSFNIVKVSHSKIQDYRRQLKIQAIKAAKDKGGYLSEAINEKLGDAVTISEPDEVATLTDNQRYRRSLYYEYGANAYLMDKSMYKARANMEADGYDAASAIDGNVDFRKIKLQFDVKVVFGLK